MLNGSQTSESRDKTMKAVLTPDDLKKGDVVSENGWYPVEIVEYEETDASDEAKNPGSTNCNFHLKIFDGPDKDKGKTCRFMVNETALGFGKKLYAALGFPKTPDGGYDLDSQLFKSTVGAKLQAYIKRGKSNRGNEFNDVQDFKPLK